MLMLVTVTTLTATLEVDESPASSVAVRSTTTGEAAPVGVTVSTPPSEVLATERLPFGNTVELGEVAESTRRDGVVKSSAAWKDIAELCPVPMVQSEARVITGAVLVGR